MELSIDSLGISLAGLILSEDKRKHTDCSELVLFGCTRLYFSYLTKYRQKGVFLAKYEKYGTLCRSKKNLNRIEN